MTAMQPAIIAAGRDAIVDRRADADIDGIKAAITAIFQRTAGAAAAEIGLKEWIGGQFLIAQRESVRASQPAENISNSVECLPPTLGAPS
jgi:hypothetical protein